ncbi:DUF3631 domain-containing protein, partial [Lentzea flava]
PLLAIADEAGGEWPERARKACVHFVTAAQTNPTSDRIRLLSDLRTVFADRGVNRMSTVEILAVLHSMDEAPWGDYYGRPINARQLATELSAYGVKVAAFKNGSKTFKGYVVDGPNGLSDAWARYLPKSKEDDNSEGEQ